MDNYRELKICCDPGFGHLRYCFSLIKTRRHFWTDTAYCHRLILRDWEGVINITTTLYLLRDV